MKLIVFDIFLHLIVATLVQTKVSAASGLVKIGAKNGTMIEESKIRGGEEIDIIYAPSQVAILLKNRVFCSGSIIKNKVILTVAHCLVYKNIPLLKVRSGSRFYDRYGRVVAVERAKIHRDYVHCETCYNFDIALLFLEDPAIALGIPASVVPLWEIGTTFGPGIYATVSGWGSIEKGSDVPSVTLRRVVVPIVAWYDCHTDIPFLSTYNICAGYSKGEIDACPGDSGAGLMVGERLAGIHAFGSCGAPKTPSGYTSIPMFRMWIWRQVNV